MSEWFEDPQLIKIDRLVADLFPFGMSNEFSNTVDRAKNPQQWKKVALQWIEEYTDNLEKVKEEVEKIADNAA